MTKRPCWITINVNDMTDEIERELRGRYFAPEPSRKTSERIAGAVVQYIRCKASGSHELRISVTETRP